MRLPPDNTFLLPADNRVCVDRADLLAPTDAEVLALLPAWVRRGASAVRDAVVASARQFWLRVQWRLGLSLGALQSPRGAEGLRLAEHGEVRQRAQAPMESEPAYRERLLARPHGITPTAIRAAVAALALLHTPIAPVVFEPAQEGLFTQGEGTGGLPWCCFVQPVGGPILWGYLPGADARGGVWVSEEADATRAVFVVLLEGPLYDTAVTPYALPESYTSPVADSDFAGAEAPFVAWGFLASEAPALDEQILREVEARRGAGVVWWLYVVPDLGGAL